MLKIDSIFLSFTPNTFTDAAEADTLFGDGVLISFSIFRIHHILPRTLTYDYKNKTNTTSTTNDLAWLKTKRSSSRLIKLSILMNRFQPPKFSS